MNNLSFCIETIDAETKTASLCYSLSIFRR